FDGRRFPPLPWGGTRVADADIAFIADWIDDGCPATEDTVTEIGAPKAASDAGQVRLADVKEFGVMEWPDWIASRPGTPRQRGNLDCMSETQLGRLPAAFPCITALAPHWEDSRN